MTGSDTQTIASRLNGVGVRVGDGAEVGVGDGANVGVGRFVGVMVGGATVETCSDPIAGWQDASIKARLRNRVFVKGKRTRTSLKEDNRILSSLLRWLTSKNTRTHILFFLNSQLLLKYTNVRLVPVR